MKTNILIAATLLFSAAASAQSPVSEKQERNNHGTEVSTVAKSEIEAGTKGEAVSAVASSKSKASVNGPGNTSEERRQRKSEREAIREARKQEHKDFIAGMKAETREDESTSVAVKADAKAKRKTTDDSSSDVDAKVKAGKSDRKAAKANRPERINDGAKVGSDVQISRPKVGAKVRGTAGLGIL